MSKTSNHAKIECLQLWLADLKKKHKRKKKQIFYVREEE